MPAILELLAANEVDVDVNVYEGDQLLLDLRKLGKIGRNVVEIEIVVGREKVRVVWRLGVVAIPICTIDTVI